MITPHFRKLPSGGGTAPGWPGKERAAESRTFFHRSTEIKPVPAGWKIRKLPGVRAQSTPGALAVLNRGEPNLDPALGNLQNARCGSDLRGISFFVSGSMDILPSRTANPVHSKLLVGIIGILALLATIGFLMIAFSKGKTK